MLKLQVPFEEQWSIFDSIPTLQEPISDPHSQGTEGSPNTKQSAPKPRLLLQASYQKRFPIVPKPVPYPGHGHGVALGLARVEDDLEGFLDNELDVSRLNAIHKHLWIAGVKRAARNLHHQKCAGHEILLTEQADLHLLWEKNRLYVKPLPNFLLCAQVWQSHLCTNQSLHERASGFLLSYIWLLCYESDFRIAAQHGLVPKQLSWEAWVSLSRSALQVLDYKELKGIDMRFRYGELRLSRINRIVRLTSPFDMSTLMRGYRHGYYNYQSLLTDNLSWLISVVVFIALILQALQTGLSTDRLYDVHAFQRASYGFVIFSIVAPVAGVVLVVVIALSSFGASFLYTRSRIVAWEKPEHGAE